MGYAPKIDVESDFNEVIDQMEGVKSLIVFIFVRAVRDFEHTVWNEQKGYVFLPQYMRVKGFKVVYDKRYYKRELPRLTRIINLKELLDFIWEPEGAKALFEYHDISTDTIELIQNRYRVQRQITLSAIELASSLRERTIENSYNPHWSSDVLLKKIDRKALSKKAWKLYDAGRPICIIAKSLGISIKEVYRLFDMDLKK